MDIDLSQFTQVFFEESLEGLEVMESELLKLNVQQPDPETINTIFRAAHSIKGGSATFGFNQVAGFTHLLETLLDEIRDGRREMTANHQDMLLLSVDLLRNMLQALMAGQSFESPQQQELENRFNQELSAVAGIEDASDNASQSNEKSAAKVSETKDIGLSWQIDFHAGADILRCGNDPILMFNELAELGELKVSLPAQELPEFEDLDPESCRLYWQLQLDTEAPLERIKEVFEWVEDDCEIHYQQLPAKTQLVEGVSPQEQAPISTSAPDSQGAATTAKVESGKAVAKTAETSSIRVSTDKIDMLINMVGELVITQAMLGQIGQQERIDDNALLSLQQGLEQLANHTRDLQESVMQIRMLPISFAFNRFPRLVRDIGQQLGKKVELILKGEETELDKTVMEKIVDPMVHLVRNSLDHGIESPAVRSAKGKPETGRITLNAFHQGGNIVIEITDDGAGLDTGRILAKARDKGLVGAEEELSTEAIQQLIFKPGFSTADSVSDLSGRGVGMDVVRRNIQALSGSVELASTPGKGSRFTIRLPLTLAILDGQLVRVGEHTYVVPLVSIYESLQVESSKVNKLSEEHEVIRLRDEYLPVIRVYQEFNHQAQAKEVKEGLVMVVDNNNQKVGLLVDELLAQQQVVIKSLEDNYAKVPGVSGATILGDGRVALIVDIPGLVTMSGLNQTQEHAA
ncbi:MULTISPECIES: chemotaxis protein CheA [Shewanella]|uniref:chemotaxis protein CheA n=1 Tax=Shewanella algae TaxID=38313 RepID=UPI000F42A133|nr:chemotaxis protein CheA [Shewanella algae]AYV11847.1 chemotaxis protein CheA [Shewanella algae]MBO2601576.1 chemotaxis protein CheA [Shewanella algae]MBO2677313.1 chemotaxis protein CheA [Shewanella algae]